MPQEITLSLPERFVANAVVNGNLIQQLARPRRTITSAVQELRVGRRSLHKITLPEGEEVVIVRRRILLDHSNVLLIPQVDSQEVDTFSEVELSKAQWVERRGQAPPPTRERVDEIRSSWRRQLDFREETDESPGLRTPQLGALHATLGHWKSSSETATIVMPTGTGKTETMLTLLIQEQPKRLLVIVPSTALREQISNKFRTLGVLRDFGIVGAAAINPSVGVLKHRPRTIEEVQSFFEHCNVVVTNMQVLGNCPEEIQAEIANQCSDLFIDEAHHVPARTWNHFRRFFRDKRLLQFTATPFRNDGKYIEGKVIFNYPLRKAQEEGYFKPINFKPVTEFDPTQSDLTIAQAAIRQLREDIENGHDHLVMARASSIERARIIQGVYVEAGEEFRPVLIHSDQTEPDRSEALKALFSRHSRIVVCVDMLGEGFDLPELKIAALHNVHKSLAITLQFTGRFTRVKPQIGEATVIANLGDAEVPKVLRSLYAEDADWNSVLRDLSRGATGKHGRRSEFLRGFGELPPEIPLQNVFPKMSAVVFKVPRGDWNPDGIPGLIDSDRLYAGPIVNEGEKTLVFVTREQDQVPWGDVREIANTTWDVYVAHWDEDRRLLFINSSNTGSQHEDVAKAIMGDAATLIRGEGVFRCLAGINHLILQNLGLKHSLSHAVRFMMYVGADIREGLAQAHTENKVKSNLFGRGFEDGERTTIGCSQKGRIWSYKVAYDLSEWVSWCKSVGEKLLDDDTEVEDLFDNLVIPEAVKDRPALVPIAIEWSEEFLRLSEEHVLVDVNGESAPFYDVGFDLSNHDTEGLIRFRISHSGASQEFEVHFVEDSVRYVPVGDGFVDVVIGKRRKSLNDWFQDEPPIIRFEDTTFLIYNQILRIPRTGGTTGYDRGSLKAWNWAGIDLNVESQTTDKLPNSIQKRVIDTLLDPAHDPAYDLVFDDDSTNEAADVVAMKVAGDRLIVHLFHLKYVHGGVVRTQVADLYEVCGQAQKCVHWKGNIAGLFQHLKHREGLRTQKGQQTRFERGDLALLTRLKRSSEFLIPEFKAIVVQPGMSKANASVEQLRLLGATELYVKETYGFSFETICSD